MVCTRKASPRPNWAGGLTSGSCLPGRSQHAGEGPGNQIAIAEMGCKVWVRSRVPSGEIVGMVIRHGEAFTITDHLTVWDGAAARSTGRPSTMPTARPTSAIASLHELEMRQYVMQASAADHERRDPAGSGRDELGVLLMGHPFKSWWTGSLLTIDERAQRVAGPERDNAAGCGVDPGRGRLDDSQPRTRGLRSR